jgi:ATP-binding cassette, subfamily B, bacterial
MFPKNPEAELGLIRSKRDTAGAFVIAMRVLVSSTQGGTPLTALLALRGTIFALLHPLNPIHQAVKANLRDPTAAWLFDRRFNEACVGPSGTGDV